MYMHLKDVFIPKVELESMTKAGFTYNMAVRQIKQKMSDQTLRRYVEMNYPDLHLLFQANGKRRVRYSKFKNYCS